MSAFAAYVVFVALMASLVLVILSGLYGSGLMFNRNLATTEPPRNGRDYASPSYQSEIYDHYVKEYLAARENLLAEIDDYSLDLIHAVSDEEYNDARQALAARMESLVVTCKQARDLRLVLIVNGEVGL